MQKESPKNRSLNLQPFFRCLPFSLAYLKLRSLHRDDNLAHSLYPKNKID